MKIFVLALIAVLLGGCSTTPTTTTSPIERRLAAPEKAFDTDGPITSLFHATLYYPEQLDLRYDGYIVGIEKSPRATIGVGDDAALLAVRGLPLQGNGVRESLDDGKRMFVSHIIRRRHGDRDRPVCALLNAYDKPKVEGGQFISPCQTYVRSSDAATAYEDSWKGMHAIADDLLSARKNGHATYTHIVVVTMGWNTDQVEAIRNVNTITHNLVKTRPSMKPLVIAVTWPGLWQSGWADLPVKIASFPNKAEDADEVGLTWLGVLLHETLPQAGLGLPVIAIGHSFGGRATAVAACSGPAISNGIARQPVSAIDSVVILQGAFPTSRLFAEREIKAGQRADCGHVRRLVMTATESDRAIKIPGSLWQKNYSGDSASFAHYCGPGQDNLRCAQADKSGEVSGSRGKLDSNILYVNTDKLMTENAYLSGKFSGSHSDIFRVEHATLIWKALESYPTPGTSASSP